MVSRRASAFTLLELVMVIVIVGIMAAMAVPRFAGHLARTRVDAAVTRVSADIKAAKRRAKLAGQSQTITFDVANGTYTVATWTSLKDSSDAYVVSLADAPYEATISSIDLGGDAAITFDGYGEPDSTGYVAVQVGPYVRKVNIATSETGPVAEPTSVTIQ